MIKNKLELLKYLEAQSGAFYKMLIGSIKTMCFSAIVTHFKECVSIQEDEESIIINLIASKL